MNKKYLLIGLMTFLVVANLAFLSIPLSLADTFQVGGSTDSGQVNLGENVSIFLNLTSTKTLDTDKSDGHLLYLYGQYALVNSSGNKLVENTPSQLSSEGYNPQIYYEFNETGQYKFGASISYAELVYNESIQEWEQIDSGIDVRDSVDINVVYPEPSPGVMSSVIATIDSIWEAFINWVIGLFT